MKKEIKILAIETSCDETAAAVICGANENSNIEIRNSKQIQNSKLKYPKVLSNVVSSQIDLHAKTGGVVPEVASRAHMEAIIPVVEEALSVAKNKIDDITHVAVTAGPGLIGSLLVGFNTAKALAYSLDLPLIPINHIEGHIYSAMPARVESQKSVKSKVQGIKFPILALTVSGGHTSLTLVEEHLKYKTLGQTIDDAAGEAFDKVAKLLGLGYPGGPEVSKFASKYRNKVESRKSIKSKVQGIEFPRPLINHPNFDFSFSGLKTAVLTHVLKLKAKSSGLTASQKEEICFAFEEAAIDVLATKTMRAAREFRPKGIILAGGVAANGRLREELKARIEKYNSEVEEKFKMNFYLPGPGMSGDNAAMIGLAAYYHIIEGEKGDWRKSEISANLQITDL
ncbi:MAG: tRNA (adenosine(37)-N6)-threonylcarbamoyltransferase complex transferase subunit TsaD [Patescibacteria group bacterium]|nr:tRNA (adenosine(37)-N6)-threonylcarbamoyltransferase complex transferase subunit TsaD [Patescibacteria group bacterium]